MKRLGGTLAILVLVACGSHDEIQPEVRAPLGSARISSYTGWFPGPWHQEVWVRLQPRVELSDVADLRVFGPLRPGMSLEEARAAAGEPTGRSTDYRGTVWSHWSNEYGTAQVGCVESCSGSDCFTSWELQAYPKHRRRVFDPSVADVVKQAVERKPEVEYRAVHVGTSEHAQTLTLILESQWGEYLRWGGPGAECGSTK